MNPADGIAALREFFAGEAGVGHWGTTPVGSSARAGRLEEWVRRGFHGSMAYMERTLAERMDPSRWRPWARSAVLFSLPYPRPLSAAATGGAAGYRVARYAAGPDYHARAGEILERLQEYLPAACRRESVRIQGFVDTAPVFERDWAARAGLGWEGKNCCTIHPEHGSGFFLAGAITDVDLPAPRPVRDHCGSCTRCLDACPTGAFDGPGVLDARKCIAYWTIEHKGPIPPGLSRDFGAWVFGCDICQEVCPWNARHAQKGAPDTPDWTAEQWLRVLAKGGGFQPAFRRTPLSRAGRRMMLRNLAIAARNRRDASAVPSLRRAWGGEDDPAVREEIGRTLQALEGTGISGPDEECRQQG